MPSFFRCNRELISRNSPPKRLRTSIEHHAVPHDGAAAPLRCTVTIGVSLAFKTAEGLDTALQQADAALYRGKAAGRNRVETARMDADGSGTTFRLAVRAGGA